MSDIIFVEMSWNVFKQDSTKPKQMRCTFDKLELTHDTISYQIFILLRHSVNYFFAVQVFCVFNRSVRLMKKNQEERKIILKDDKAYTKSEEVTRDKQSWGIHAQHMDSYWMDLQSTISAWQLLNYLDLMFSLVNFSLGLQKMNICWSWLLCGEIS